MAESVGSRTRQTRRALSALVAGALLASGSVVPAARAAEAAATHREPVADPPAPDAETASPVLESRIRRESEIIHNPFGITPHRPNYLLPLTYAGEPNQAPFADAGSTVDLDHAEIKFQISFKIPMLTGVFDRRARLYFGYSQVSWWQAYNDAESSPFRETNYEPELMLAIANDWKLFGFTNRFNLLGFAHQSNGRTEPLSRSWNRLYGQFVFERDHLVVSLKPWWRIPESAEEDDNPDIEDYLGHAEVQLLYARDARSRSAILRYNPATDRGSVQFDWTFPFADKLKGYLQYFNGYGESLIDYDHHTQRIGLGLLLTDWL